MARRLLACGAVLCVALAGLLTLPRSFARSQTRYPAFPISVAVAEDRLGQPVVPAAWVTERVSRANEIFADAGAFFEIRETRSLDPRFFALGNRADRNALAASLHPGLINVFVVASLADVDATGFRMGVHWRPPRAAGAHFVILAQSAMPTTLAHELGHFFGNPHSPTPNNIMGYARDGLTPPVFDAIQLRRIGDHAARFRRSREISL